MCWWRPVVGRSSAVDSSNVILRIAAAITTGAIALSIAQPTDLVKIRMQSTRGRYQGCLHAYRTIVREERVRGLWKGLSVCSVIVPRSSMIMTSSRELDLQYRCLYEDGTDSLRWRYSGRNKDEYRWRNGGYITISRAPPLIREYQFRRA